MDKSKNIPRYKGNVSPEFLARALERFDDYKNAKLMLAERINENNTHYRQQYAEWLNSDKNKTKPSTGFIFSSVENKYADAIDNYPIPTILEREPGDEKTAGLLTKILPVQLEESKFKEAYKRNWRRKLKHGTAVYGVFYNTKSREISINVIDLMNIYVDMNIEDPQDSQFLFISNAIDNDTLKHMYPAFSELFEGDCSVDTAEGSTQIKDRTIVTDCYYKKMYENERGELVKAVHMMKLCEGYILDATEDNPQTAEGLYLHGMYPVVFDVLYPVENCPFGFGVVDVIKNPQRYIDELDGLIIKNAMIAGKQRFIIRDNGGINEKEFCDYTKDIIHAAGSVDEDNVRPFQAEALPEFIMQHRMRKIDELKEVSGNRDFQQGGTAGGVTSGTAITILQESGEKLSRAMIDGSYDAFARIVYLVIELMREFYTDERIYRITGTNGMTDFVSFNSSMLYHTEGDVFGMPEDKRPAMFDIEVVPQKQNPFSREANNSTLVTLWQAGLLKPENVDGALAVLECMSFDGKDKLIRSVEGFRNGTEM